MSDFFEQGQQAEQVKSQMSALQEDLIKIEVVGESGAGLVQVALNGAMEVKRVRIDVSLKTEDWAAVEELVAAAFTDATRKLREEHKRKLLPALGSMGALLGGINAS